MASEHKTLNSSKGTIRYRNFPNHSEEEIQGKLARYKMIEVKSINTRTNTQFQSQLYILTFDSCTIPLEVKIGYTKFKVQEYVPKPRRCFQCQRWGHGSNSCRENQKTCINCGDFFHGNDCRRPPNCSNCKENHPATSKECFYYRLESETLCIKTKNRLSYLEAKKVATNNILSNVNIYASVEADRSAPVKERRPPVPVRPTATDRADAAMAPAAPTATGATSSSTVARAIAPSVASSRATAASTAGPSGCNNTTNNNVTTDAITPEANAKLKSQERDRTKKRESRNHTSKTEFNETENNITTVINYRSENTTSKKQKTTDTIKVRNN